MNQKIKTIHRIVTGISSLEIEKRMDLASEEGFFVFGPHQVTVYTNLNKEQNTVYSVLMTKTVTIEDSPQEENK